jgi:hypothetical protein
VARSGLELLASPIVHRESPHEGSVLVTLTLLVEDLSRQLGQPGASDRDLRDSLTLLKTLPDTKASVRETKRYWIPYLRHVLRSGLRPEMLPRGASVPPNAAADERRGEIGCRSQVIPCVRQTLGKEGAYPGWSAA